MTSTKSFFDEHYSNSLSEFSKRMVTNEGFINEGFVRTSVKKMLEGRVDEESFKILSVGAGDGHSDMVILNLVKDELLKHEFKCKKIVNTVVDPSEYFLHKYKSMVNELWSQPIGNGLTTFKFHNITIEEYLNSLAKDVMQKARFDLILMIHCIFYLPDPEGTLEGIFNQLLAPQGRVFCLMLQDGVLRLTYKHCAVQHTPMNVTKPTELVKAYAEDVLQFAEKHSWKHGTFKEVLEHKFDLTDAFDEFSTSGNLVLDFVTLTRDFRKNSSSKLVQEVLKILHEETNRNDDGRKIGIVKDCFVIFCK